MNVIIAGGSGFLGRALHARLVERGDAVRILTRRPSRPEHLQWSPSDENGAWATAVAEADAVVNLSGESIDSGRWTAARKQALVESRLSSTDAIVKALARTTREGVLLNASAMGYYGSRGEERLTESSAPGDDFLATLCRRWESEAMKAAGSRRVVRLRTTLVLDDEEGALAKMLTPFRLGVGGPFGNGRRSWSWIHREDWVRLVMFAIGERRLEGPLNLSTPNPIPNGDFARLLGRALHRPAILPAPGFALRLLLGEMADGLLASQRIAPARALSLGFVFRFPDLEGALRDLLRR